MKKLLVVLAFVGTIALGASAPALATTYPAPPPQGTVSSGTITAGGSVVFSGTGFTPGETINITVTQTAAAQGAAAPGGAGGVTMAVPAVLPLAPLTLSTVADASGAFSVTITLDSPGTYVLTAVGATSGRTVSATVVVTGTAGLANTGGAPLANTGAGLASTGVDSGLILWVLVGTGALAAGATSVMVVRRRAKNENVTAA